MPTVVLFYMWLMWSWKLRNLVIVSWTGIPVTEFSPVHSHYRAPRKKSVLNIWTCKWKTKILCILFITRTWASNSQGRRLEWTQLGSQGNASRHHPSPVKLKLFQTKTGSELDPFHLLISQMWLDFPHMMWAKPALSNSFPSVLRAM